MSYVAFLISCFIFFSGLELDVYVGIDIPYHWIFNLLAHLALQKSYTCSVCSAKKKKKHGLNTTFTPLAPYNLCPFVSVQVICSAVSLLACVPLVELFFFHMILIRKVCSRKVCLWLPAILVPLNGPKYCHRSCCQHFVVSWNSQYYVKILEIFLVM